MQGLKGASGNRLTVSGEELPEVNGEGDPVLADQRVFVAPEADVHGAGARLGGQSSEVDGLVSEGVLMPALSFICGKSIKSTKVSRSEMFHPTADTKANNSLSL